jgi:hypothetical protein
MHKSWLLTLTVFLGLAHSGLSQHMPGVAMGNFAGTNALVSQPRICCRQPLQLYVNVVGSQFYTANNHVKYEAPYSFLSLITNTVSDEYRNERGVLQFPRSYLGENSMATINTSMRVATHVCLRSCSTCSREKLV